MTKYGDCYRFNVRNLANLNAGKLSNPYINMLHAKRGQSRLYLYKETPLYKSLCEQAMSRLHLVLQNSQLERRPLILLDQFCNQEPCEPKNVIEQREEHAAEEDIAMLYE
jgi:hypothetical protein